jgi:hypothetical protein
MTTGQASTKADVAALRRALRELKIEVEVPSPTSAGRRADLIVRDGAKVVAIEVKSGPKVPSPAQVKKLVEAGRTSGAKTHHVLVADRVLSSSAQVLEKAGWNWFERRGRLHLFAPGLRIDVPVASSLAPPRSPAAMATAVGREVAAALLVGACDGEDSSIRRLAATTQRSVGAVQGALKALRSEGLLDDRGPLVPDLFWALVEPWRLHERPSWALEDLPTPLDQLLVRGEVAGASWGAPVVLGAGAPLDLLAGAEYDLNALHFRIGPVGVHVATLSVASASVLVTTATEREVSVPLPGVAGVRPARRIEKRFVIHPVFVALELAAERARGREILEEWTELPEGKHHVW